ncbi:hypothetical protein GQR58_016621 [Nymphon striatum]|nr:hypothetical protein GQR58_016621 [Nymphon striatum]
MPRRHLSEPEVARALGMLEAGLGQRRVAQTMGVSHSVISRVNQRHQETGLYSETPRSGRPVLTTPRDDRYLMNLCLRNRFHSARRLNNDFAAATGCNFQSLTFAVLGWCLRTLNSPSGYGHVHVQVFKVPPLYKRQLNAVQLVYSLFWGVLSFNVQGMSKMS